MTSPSCRVIQAGVPQERTAPSEQRSARDTVAASIQNGAEQEASLDLPLVGAKNKTGLTEIVEATRSGSTGG